MVKLPLLASPNWGHEMALGNKLTMDNYLIQPHFKKSELSLYGVPMSIYKHYTNTENKPLSDTGDKLYSRFAYS